MTVLYHFTGTHHLASILRDGCLRPSESNVGTPRPPPGMDRLPPVGEHLGPDVVWMLDTPEITHPHGLVNALTGTAKTRVRFTVDVDATRWTSWPPARRMNPQWRAAMIRTGGGKVAAKHWWVTQRPVPASAWLAVDIRQDDGSWRPLPLPRTPLEMTA